MSQFRLQFDQQIFSIIEPPQQYPPSLQYLLQQNDAYFIKQCKRFLANQKDTYLLSKKIETNLKKILESSREIQEIVSKKDSGNEKIYKQLRKLNESKHTLEKRSETLGMICDMVKLEGLRSLLLLQNEKTMSQQLVPKSKLKPSGSDKSLPSQPHQPSNKPISEQQKRQYLHNLTKIYTVVKQSRTLQQSMQNGKFPLIQSILDQLHELFSKAIDKALSPSMLTPDMISLILQQFYQPFLLQENLYVNSKRKTPKEKFYEAIIANRVQKYRLELNPMINNLNYAINVIQLYDSILSSWVRIIDQDLQLFSKSAQVQIVKSATKTILNQAMPKLQKNTYKMKQMSQLCFIRFRIHQFLNKLTSLELLQTQTQNKSVQKWQPLPDMLQKMRMLLQGKVQEESEKLSSTKYNIYSLASYVPVREYLETIKQCIEYDFQRPPDLEFTLQVEEENERSPRSPNTKKQHMKYLDWQSPFYLLASSRKPQSQPNNKSLVIFNLNIWYLYLKIIKQPSHKILAVETMLWCKEKFIQMNIKECHKVYYQSLDKILELCGNLPVFRNTLYAEINMLGHEDLRKEVAQGIKEKFLTIYQQMLQKIGKQKMNNEQVKTFCKDNKINLNKFGKFSNQICIYSSQQLSQLIEYN